MCGIAGVVRFDTRHPVSEERLQRMRDSLIHRGPDGAGMIISGRAGLAHRRLSIIDLAAGRQPMSNDGQRIWLTYNGEIYNYRELRRQLETLGCRFETQSDTEVVIKAYEVYGDDCVDHFQGMFAFALWDVARERLFMARDRLGIKPLYYSVSDTELLFGSEIKAILAGMPGRPSFNRSILPEFLASRYVAGDETFYEGIRKLMPATVFSWSAAQGVRQRSYWQPPLSREDRSLKVSDYVEQIREGLKQAVSSHLVSDVPVGLFLSGGIDSSALAAIMAPMVDGPIHTFSVGFAERAANELDYARIAARSIGSIHRDITVTSRQFFDALPRLVWHEDEPIAFTSSVPLHLLSTMAREHVKVVLTGEGADELFLGYDYRYRVTALNKRLGDVYAGLLSPGMRDSVANMVAGLPRSLRRYGERTFLAMDSTPRDLFCENFSVFRQLQRGALLRDQDLTSARDPFAEILRHYHGAGGEPLQSMSHADIRTYLVELLMKQDQMSMSASLESRVPFLDHRLVEMVAAIPGRYRLRGLQTKALLRDAVRDIVPAQIMNRKKMGFPVPLGTWLRGPWECVVDEFVLGARSVARGHFHEEELQRLAGEHRLGVADHGERLWLLINLEMWQRIFLEGEDPQDIYSTDRLQASTIRKGTHGTAAASMAG